MDDGAKCFLFTSMAANMMHSTTESDNLSAWHSDGTCKFSERTLKVKVSLLALHAVENGAGCGCVGSGTTGTNCATVQICCDTLKLSNAALLMRPLLGV